MTGKYWIKLYHEILEDPKMMRMNEAVFARCIKIFLLAGKSDDDGYLPSVDDMAWHLRLSESEVEATLAELEKVNIIISENGRWKVRKFTERNKAMEPAEKMKRYRGTKHHEEYALPISYQPVTKSNVDTDIDREKDKDNRIVTEEEQESNASSEIPVTFSNNILRIISQATGIVAVPPKEYERIEQIHSLINAYGDEAVFKAIEKAFNRWCKAKTKNGRPYSRVNFGWIDWAQDELSGGGEKDKPISQMTDAEYLDYKLRGSEVPDG